MGIIAAHPCETVAQVIPVFPVSIKAYGEQHLTDFVGHHGKTMFKMCLF